MKNNFVALIRKVASFVLPFAPLTALAQLQPPGGGAPAPIQNLPQAVQYVCAAAGWFFTFLIILAIIFVILAAYSYLTAQGDPEKVKNASHKLIYAAIAVAVAIVARGFPLVIGSFFVSNFQGCQ